jgi:protein-S-isoprenylcysteine O-methyltransferase Ste14
MARLGAWLFTQRTWLPLPLALALLLLPSTDPSPVLFWAGAALVAAGEAVRVWAVAHIGSVSRTRTDRVGPLVETGPFAHIRNPLYVGNATLWVGFALSAGLPWVAPVFLALLGFEYHAIVRWEEQLLESRLGDAYRGYMARVPRWVPTLSASNKISSARLFSWQATLFSERGTLIAIAVGYLLLAVKEGLRT